MSRSPRRRHPLAVVSLVLAVVSAGGIGAIAISATGTAPDRAAAAVRSVFPDAADFCYAQMMMPHHEQAARMSGMLLAKPGISERSQRFAEFVATDQTAEVTATRAWADAWRTAYEKEARAPVTTPAGGHAHAGAAVAADADSAPLADVDALVDCGDAGVPDRFAAMPGMLSDAQLARLDAAEGVEAEVLFLELMIPHHVGALEMSRDILSSGSNRYIVQMAKHILEEQDREIVAMRTMIDQIAP